MARYGERPEELYFHASNTEIGTLAAPTAVVEESVLRGSLIQKPSVSVWITA